ncbi:hypothetical protein V8G54_023524 [Vigna mungo]|uniref:Uncharacterized protein n=1 Tax=Vigna mungo TaxID=3915 RepID=A0AAQ3RRN7_VIGMU
MHRRDSQYSADDQLLDFHEDRVLLIAENCFPYFSQHGMNSSLLEDSSTFPNVLPHFALHYLLNQDDANYRVDINMREAPLSLHNSSAAVFATCRVNLLSRVVFLFESRINLLNEDA